MGFNRFINQLTPRPHCWRCARPCWPWAMAVCHPAGSSCDSGAGNPENGVLAWKCAWNATFRLDFFFALRQSRADFFDSSTAKIALDVRFLSILTSKFTFRHSGVQFLILHLTRWLRTALASLIFDPPEPGNIGKTQCFVTFLSFHTPWSSFYWLFLF